jgi:VanZ family protein
VVSFLVRRALKYWLPVLLWTVFIFVGSSDLMSAEHTSRFIGPFLRWFVPDITDATVASIQFIVRKCAHLTEYAVLAALIWRALRFQLPERTPRTQALLALLAAVTCAAFDEFHQSFVPSRTSSPGDVAIDGAGALLGLVVYRLITRRVGSIESRKCP